MQEIDKTRYSPWVRKLSRRRHGSALQYSCLENLMQRAWWLQSLGSQRVIHAWSNPALTHASQYIGASQVVQWQKNSPNSAGVIEDLSLIPGTGKSSGVGNGNSLQYSCLGNPMDRGDWWSTVHGVTESQTLLSIHTEMRQYVTEEKIKIWRSRGESRWWRNRTGRSLSLLQTHQKNNRTVNKVYKTTSDR